MKFENKLTDKGEKESEGYYESVTINEVTLSVGDLVVFNDPDAGAHAGECELVHSSEWVVEVTEIWKMWNEYNEEFELRIGNSGLGWVWWEDIAIPGKKGNGHLTGNDAKHKVERFEDSEYERYMYWEYHSGREGAPEKLWEIYEREGGNSGPNCEYCMGDGIRVGGS